MEEQRFQRELENRVKEIEAVLKKYMPQESGCQKTVLEAVNYSLMAGGKRLRPMLLQETYRMFGGKGDLAEPFMAALEMIHTYSLVHDDLPAMDNDSYRRGRETTWRVYGEGMGILAGDGLLNLAFETALSAFSRLQEGSFSEHFASLEEAYGAVSQALMVLAAKAGVYGMIGGQTADIEAEDCPEALSIERLLFIHEKKTAALIQAAMMVGAILAGASKEQVELMEQCAHHVGVAFQIQDDILDVTGDSREMGKQAGSDAQNNKQTYVTIRGLEGAMQEVARLSEEAIEMIQGLPGEHEFLEQLIHMLIHRKK